MHDNSAHNRRGITLLEVLIAIGILAVGLTSVVALVPAGRSNAGQALIYDRAFALAENSLNDAVTFGCLKLRTLGVATGSTNNTIILDAAPTAGVLGATAGTLARKGIYASSAAEAANAAPTAVLGQFLQLRDDIVLQPGANEDALPRYRNIDGVRGFDGRFTCMLALAPLSGTMSAGSRARLTAVVFHNRDLNTPVVQGTWDSDGALIFMPPGDRTPAATFHTGSGFVSNGRFYRARSVSYDAANRAHVLYSGTSLFTSGTAFILVDSVGVAERFVTLEGGGPYSQ
jgi:type II secretory pathway pseudopilin PulG